MAISLKNWIRNKLQEVEEMHDYGVATDTVRCWIDEWEGNQTSDENSNCNKPLVSGSALLPDGFKVYECTNCHETNVKRDNGEIRVGFCDKCDHPLWN